MKQFILMLAVSTAATAVSAQKSNVPPPPPPPPAIAKEAPQPPAPPAVPLPPADENKTGYSLSVKQKNGENIVLVKKDGVTEKVTLEKWNANKSYYEKKYGKLPPPPPPPPPAPPAPPKAPQAPAAPSVKY